MSDCLSADIWIRMQLQQWRDGAVSDGGEAAANPDEAAQGEHTLAHLQHCLNPKWESCTLPLRMDWQCSEVIAELK